MSYIKKIEELLNDYLKESNQYVYSIEEVREFGFNILRVLIDSKDLLDTDSIERINNYLSEKLDAYNPFNGREYMLEVSSAGIEKEIRNEQELIESIDEYIFVEANGNEYYGYLVGYEDNELSLKINLKGRMKVIKIKYNEVKFIRHAIKF